MKHKENQLIFETYAKSKKLNESNISFGGETKVSSRPRLQKQKVSKVQAEPESEYKVGDRVYLTHGDEHYDVDIEYPGKITHVEYDPARREWFYWYLVDGEPSQYEDGPYDAADLKPYEF